MGSNAESGIDFQTTRTWVPQLHSFLSFGVENVKIGFFTLFKWYNSAAKSFRSTASSGKVVRRLNVWKAIVKDFRNLWFLQRFQCTHSYMTQALYTFRNGCVGFHLWCTVGKLIKRSNWRRVYFPQRRIKHPASASQCDSSTSCCRLICDVNKNNYTPIDNKCTSYSYSNHVSVSH